VADSGLSVVGDKCAEADVHQCEAKPLQSET
jgi:hypothetical protein